MNNIMSSKLSLDILKSKTTNYKYYSFLYDELEKIMDCQESFGHTRVRFVSRRLRGKNPTHFRHVFLEFQRGIPKKRNNASNARVYIAEHAPFWSTVLEERQEGMFDWDNEVSIQLPNIPYGMTEIMTYDSKLQQLYIPGFRDCRHHTYDMLKFCYPINE